MLICLDFATGKQLWRRDTHKDFTVIPNFFGVGSTPVLEDGLLLTMVGGQPNSGMVAFDAKTGKTVWTSTGKQTWDGTAKISWPGEPRMIWRGQEKMASYASPSSPPSTANAWLSALCDKASWRSIPKPVRNTSSAGSAARQ